MPKYTMSMSLATSFFTTVEAENETEAIKIAEDKFFNLKDVQEGDAEWQDDCAVEEVE
jgi:hypothetical protein